MPRARDASCSGAARTVLEELDVARLATLGVVARRVEALARVLEAGDRPDDLELAEQRDRVPRVERAHRAQPEGEEGSGNVGCLCGANAARSSDAQGPACQQHSLPKRVLGAARAMMARLGRAAARLEANTVRRRQHAREVDVVDVEEQAHSRGHRDAAVLDLGVAEEAQRLVAAKRREFQRVEDLVASLRADARPGRRTRGG